MAHFGERGECVGLAEEGGDLPARHALGALPLLPHDSAFREVNPPFSRPRGDPIAGASLVKEAPPVRLHCDLVNIGADPDHAINAIGSGHVAVIDKERHEIGRVVADENGIAGEIGAIESAWRPSALHSCALQSVGAAAR